MQESEALFDPGFAELAIAFEANMSACNGVIGQLKSPHQKKFKFQILYPQMYKLIENNVAFYYGCLLWGYYLANSHKNNPTKLTDNPFSELSEEDLKEYDMTYDIDYLINYLPKFENDTKYFLGKPANIPLNWKEILEQYREFVVLNNGFITVRLTSDILMPESLKVTMPVDDIKDFLCNTISSGKLEDILNIRI